MLDEPTRTERTQRSAFVLHMSPSGLDRMPEALESGEILLGWSAAGDFTPDNVTWESMREQIHTRFYADEVSYRRTGAAAGMVWRFVKEMQVGDLVVVPYGAGFYIARVSGPARYDHARVDSDTANRRAVEWLNDGKPIPRGHARAALQGRMKSYQTLVRAQDLIDEIDEAIALSSAQTTPSFRGDLRSALIDKTVHELRHGRLGPDGFERLIADVLRALGAVEARVVPHRVDKGADVVADFKMAETTTIRLAVQAKHYLPEPPVEPSAIDQLIAGMSAENADIGWVVTSGTFSGNVEEYTESKCNELDLKIDLLDGNQFAALIVEGGLRRLG